MIHDHSDAPPALVGGRFAITARLGAGAQGEVWGASDTLTGEPAVVKLVTRPDPAARARFRWEVASLRGLHLPGVVRLLDADEEPERAWLAMVRVEGGPFPGALPPRWRSLAPAVEATLGALAAVHRIGLVHGDLKPSNVLITPTGQPVLVDFGLSREVGARADRAGTPRYRAPEQAAGEEVDGRADLYALGRMVLDALDGDPDPPDEVIAALQSFCAEDPDDRPESAAEALRQLGLDGRERVERAMDRLLPGGDVLLEQTLQAIFAGHQRLLHLPGDGARALWLRTGGERARVAGVLAAWLREGLACWEEDRIRLPRPALEALAGGLWPSGEARVDGLDPGHAAWLPWIDLLGAEATPARLGALWPESATKLDAALEALVRAGAVLRDGDALRVLAWPTGLRARLLPVPRAEAHRRAAALLPQGARLPHLIAARAPPLDVSAEAATVAEDLLVQGRPAEAIAVIERCLPGLRAADPSVEARLLRIQVRGALSLLLPVELDRALCAVDRCPAPLGAERSLLRAARCGVDGEGMRALSILDETPTLQDADLEIWRAAMRVHAAQRCRPSRLEPTLVALRPWAMGVPAREAALAGWEGALAYRQERYAEAAVWHERSAEGKPALSARRSSWLNAAYAWLELGGAERAVALAEAARDSAEASRHARHALEAELVQRAARLRRVGAELWEKPDPELVEIASSLGRPASGALAALLEATLAFRRGEAAPCRALAERAARGFTQERMSGPALLCRGLANALDPQEGAAEALIDEAARVAEPGLAVQAAALAAWSAPSEPTRSAAYALLIRRAAELSIPPATRQEVLSVDEALGRLR